MVTTPRVLQAWLGHRNIQHTVRYTELAPDRFKSFCAIESRASIRNRLLPRRCLPGPKFWPRFSGEG